MIGHELEQLAHEDDPITIMRALGKRGLAEGSASALDDGQEPKPANWVMRLSRGR